MFIAFNHDVRLVQANGGFIMSASHNPGGPEYDWGIKVILEFMLQPFFSVPLFMLYIVGTNVEKIRSL